ncbi:hypothetical protein ON010_g16922 [Phytophthora cinnamomi]|nr:hypothetical protein ON010_g16922 [Phytophthora cinnamomi]
MHRARHPDWRGRCPVSRLSFWANREAIAAGGLWMAFIGAQCSMVARVQVELSELRNGADSLFTRQATPHRLSRCQRGFKVRENIAQPAANAESAGPGVRSGETGSSAAA